MRDIIKMYVLFLSAFVVGLSGSMMPGSLLTYTIRQSLRVGWPAGFIITAGHAFLELILLGIIFLGFGLILESVQAQIAIGIVGGLLLSYMGLDMLKSSYHNRLAVEQQESAAASSKSMFLSGIVISAANPYFLLWWAVIGMGFVMQSYTHFGTTGVVVYYIGHISADVAWYGALSIIIGTTRKFIKENVYRIIIAILGAMLIFFGAGFVYGAILKLTALI